jgi:hypothetical protein
MTGGGLGPPYGFRQGYLGIYISDGTLSFILGEYVHFYNACPGSASKMKHMAVHLRGRLSVAQPATWIVNSGVSPKDIRVLMKHWWINTNFGSGGQSWKIK